MGFLLTEFSWTTIRIVAWISNRIRLKQRDVITHQYADFDRRCR